MSEQVLMTREELEASKGATGRIVRIVGPVRVVGRHSSENMAVGLVIDPSAPECRRVLEEH